VQNAVAMRKAEHKMVNCPTPRAFKRGKWPKSKSLLENRSGRKKKEIRRKKRSDNEFRELSDRRGKVWGEVTANESETERGNLESFERQRTRDTISNADPAGKKAVSP